MLKLPILADMFQLLRQSEVILFVLKDLESSDFTQTMEVGDIITACYFQTEANTLSLLFTFFSPNFNTLFWFPISKTNPVSVLDFIYKCTLYVYSRYLILKKGSSHECQENEMLVK